MTSTEKIKALIPNLPNKDISIGYKFLENRDFQSLKDLIDSAIIKIKNNYKNESPKEEYLAIDMEQLQLLKAEVDVYYMQLDIPLDENKYCVNYDG